MGNPTADVPAQLTLPSALRAAGAIVLPGSKSISTRTLLLSAMAEGVTTLVDLLDADDTARMREALGLLGVHVERIDARQVRVHGTAGMADGEHGNGRTAAAVAAFAAAGTMADSAVEEGAAEDIPGSGKLSEKGVAFVQYLFQLH